MLLQILVPNIITLKTVQVRVTIPTHSLNISISRICGNVPFSEEMAWRRCKINLQSVVQAPT